jgi:hypothetical protein
MDMVDEEVFRQSKYHGLIHQTKKIKTPCKIFFVFRIVTTLETFGDVSVEGMKGN